MELGPKMAAVVAMVAHHGQERKGGARYITHPRRVAAKVATFGPDFEVVAILHDVLEDTDWKVGDLVAHGLTKDQLSGLIAMTRNATGEETYFEYVERASQNPIAREVKIADVEDNLADEFASSLLRQRGPRAIKVLKAAARPASVKMAWVGSHERGGHRVRGHYRVVAS